MELPQPTAISPEEVDRVVQDLSSEFEATFGAVDVRRMVVGSRDVLLESRQIGPHERGRGINPPSFAGSGQG